ncbi:MAG: xanthine dehydrogenase accessory protein XdhC [Myxococcales bacterium]|nr:xanthine dehydrogenase accessory protein XdhC [Myxococcales bacterium]
MNDPLNAQRVLEALVEARRHRAACTVVTVVGFAGSTPRKPGAKMLVYSNGDAIGTIGGGALEYEICERAQKLAPSGETKLVRIHLTHELGMCCGGGVDILMESQAYAPRLLIFGAGHVGLPLASLASQADFDVTVIDHREELNTPERFPNVKRLVSDPADVMDTLLFDKEQTYVVILTHDHALDERIAGYVLPLPYRFLGIIGSSRKREMFRKRLLAAGHDESKVDKIETPVGVRIHAETPFEIAVSITARLVELRRASGES